MRDNVRLGSAIDNTHYNQKAFVWGLVATGVIVFFFVFLILPGDPKNTLLQVPPGRKIQFFLSCFEAVQARTPWLAWRAGGPERP